MTLVICVVSRGRSRGKTCLIEALTKQFAGEGFRVATVKHINGSLDTANKDTWRHLKAVNQHLKNIEVTIKTE